MKRLIPSLACLCAVTIVVISACQKNYHRGVAVTPVDDSVVYALGAVPALFKDLRSTAQSITVTAGRDTVVVGAKGTAMHFYPNSFKDAAGNIITSGAIDIQLTEMVKVGDMIQNRATTMDGDQPLISGGQVDIRVTKGGAEVFANKYGIAFKQSAPSTQPMVLYYGSTNNADSIVTWTTGNNNSDTAGNRANGTVGDSSSRWNGWRSGGGGGGGISGDFFLFDSCTDFRFVNCDHPFTSGSALIRLFIKMPDTSYNPGNTCIYVCFPTYNNVTQPYISHFLSKYLTNENRRVIYDTLAGTLYAPIGTQYKIVLMTKKQDNYFYSEGTGTVADDTVRVTANLASDTRTSIIAKLQAL